MDFLQGLNPQQQAAVSHVEGPLLLLAGAGQRQNPRNHPSHGAPDGRASRARPLHPGRHLHQQSRRRNALAREQSSGRVGKDGPLVSTFHSFCVRLLRRDGASLAEIRNGFTRQFTIYDADDQVAVIKAIFRGLGLDEKFMQYRAMCSWISHKKSHKESPQDVYGASTDQKTSQLASHLRTVRRPPAPGQRARFRRPAARIRPAARARRRSALSSAIAASNSS